MLYNRVRWVVEFLTRITKLAQFYSKNKCTESNFILKTDISWSLQKLGIIPENKAHLNSMLAKLSLIVCLKN